MGPKGLIIIILLVIGSNILSSKRDKNYVNRTQDNKAYNINNYYNSRKRREIESERNYHQNKIDSSLFKKIIIGAIVIYALSRIL